MNKKTISLFIIICMITTAALSSCKEENYEKAAETKSSIYEYYDALKYKLGKTKNLTEAEKSLIGFLKANGFVTKKLGNNNILCMSKETSEILKNKNYKKRPVTFIAAYDNRNLKNDNQAISIGLSSIKNMNADKCGILILSPRRQSYHAYKTSLSSIPHKYLNSNAVIYLMWNNKTKIFTQGAQTYQFNMVKYANYSKPKGSKAYEISIKGLMPANSGDISEKRTNPIIWISELLASMKSGGMTIELAKFTCDSSVDMYPTKAKAVIVIDNDAAVKFEKKLENSVEEFRDENREKAPDAKLTFKKVRLPDKVLNYNETSEILSLLYTLKKQILATSRAEDEGEPTVISNIYNINIGSQITIAAIGRSVDPTAGNVLKNTFRTSSALSDFHINIKKKYFGWNSVNSFRLVPSEPTNDNTMPEEVKEQELSELTSVIIEAFDNENLNIEPANLFKEELISPLSRLVSKDTNILTLGVNIDDASEICNGLIYAANKIQEKN